MKNKTNSYGTLPPPRPKSAPKKRLTLKKYREAYDLAALLVAAAEGDEEMF